VVKLLPLVYFHRSKNDPGSEILRLPIMLENVAGKRILEATQVTESQLIARFDVTKFNHSVFSQFNRAIRALKQHYLRPITNRSKIRIRWHQRY
jgi:hypothetical protein